jgi:hypothetical protein
MFTKTSIALTIIVAICSGAVAAEKRQRSAADAFGNSRTIVECTHGAWDAYGLRCDGAE